MGLTWTVASTAYLGVELQLECWVLPFAGLCADTRAQKWGSSALIDQVARGGGKGNQWRQWFNCGHRIGMSYSGRWKIGGARDSFLKKDDAWDDRERMNGVSWRDQGVEESQPKRIACTEPRRRVVCLGEVFCHGWSRECVECDWGKVKGLTYLERKFYLRDEGGWLWKILGKFVYFSKLTWAPVWKRINFSRAKCRVVNNSIKKHWGTLPKLGLYFIILGGPERL